jgi:hypothetical protein
MKNSILKSALLLFIAITISSCSSSDDNSNNPTPIPNSREVKYEITGNYTGHFSMVYTDNLAVSTTVTVTSLPWTKSITYPTNIVGIGMGGGTLIGNQGIAGQTATLKIYSNNVAVATSTGTADVNGIISFQTLSYVFP